MEKTLWTGCLAFLFLACSTHNSSNNNVVPLSNDVSARQKLTIEQLTSIFENSTPSFQYGYIQDIGDGAGVTAGRIGFNTSAGDLLDVVQDYVQLVPNSPLKKYIKCLHDYHFGGAGVKPNDYSCLFPSVDAKTLASDDFKMNQMQNYDFGLDWTKAANDPIMQKVQDDFDDANEFQPAMQWAEKLGIQSVLGKAFLYDTLVQMGGPEDMLAVMLPTFKSQHGGRSKPIGSQEELEWLKLYQDARIKVLSRDPIGATTVDRVISSNQVGWPKSGSANLNLVLPISFVYSGEAFTITETTK